ncbi:MAG: mycothiol transferase [Mycobacterium sp.]
MHDAADAPAARELLRDSFTRLIEHVDDLTDDLSDEVSFYRPTTASHEQANSICWLVWHSARIQDAQLAHIAGIDQVWFSGGWVDRFALDLPRDAHGYGHTPEEVGKVRAPADLLAGYYHAVHKMSLEYVAGVTTDELARVVDTNWNPPVTASARLVSIIDDCAQHLGQAAYVRGITP